MSEFKSAEGDVGRLEGSFSRVGPAALGAVAGVTALAGAALALGKQAFDLGAAFDEAYDRIRIQTGATGDALESLQGSFRNIAAGVPASFEEISTAVAGLNQRLGLTGEPLEALATQVLNLSRITGTDLNENIRLSTRLFGDWAIETSRQADTLDLLFRASQATGQSVGTLAAQVVQFGAPLRQLGFSLEESLALLGSFEREGVNTEQVMGSLRIAIGNLAREGIPLESGFRGVVEIIGEMEDASAATALAMEVFGARAGPDMAAAIREGRFAVDEMVDSILGAGDSINDVAADTDDAAERWTKAQNRMALAVEPVATAVFDLATKVVEELIPPIQEAAAWATPFVQTWAETVPGALSATGQAIDRLIADIARLAGANVAAQNAQRAALAGGISPEIASTITDPRQAAALSGIPQAALGPVLGQTAPDPGAVATEIAESIEQGAAAAETRAREAGARVGDETRAAILAAFGGRSAAGGATGGAGRTGGSTREAITREAEVIVFDTLAAFDEATERAVRDASFGRAFGDIPGRAAAALVEAASRQDAATVSALVRSQEQLIAELEKAAVPEWETLADVLRGAFRAVVESPDDATVQAALSWLQTVGIELANASQALIADKLQAELDAQFERLGENLAANAERALEGVGRAMADADRSITQLLVSQAESRAVRGQREEFTDRQTEAMERLTAGIDRQREAWRSYREEQALVRAEAKELADLEASYAERRASLIDQARRAGQRSGGRGSRRASGARAGAGLQGGAGQRPQYRAEPPDPRAGQPASKRPRQPAGDPGRAAGGPRASAHRERRGCGA